MNVDLIEEIRKRKMMTQANLAQSIDFTVTGYQKILKTGDIKVSTLEKICEVFAVDISVFFDKKSLVSEPIARYGITQKDGKTVIHLEPKDRVCVQLDRLTVEIVHE